MRTGQDRAPHCLRRLLPLLLACCIGPLWADAGADKRIAALSGQIAQNPDNQNLRLQRALLYLDDNQAELALADIVEAEQRGDPLAAAYAHGVLLYRQGDYGAARPYLDRYIEAYPEQWSARDYRARLLRDIGESALAVQDYETLISLNPDLDPGYYLATARLLAALPERGTDEALALLDQRIAERGPVSVLQRYAVELEAERGNYQAAIARMADFDQALRATPQWQLEVAQLLLQAGRSDEALAYIAVAEEQLRDSRATVINQQLAAEAQTLKRQTAQ